MSDVPQNKKPEVQRDASGRIMPGSTGNPGGRPKVVVELQALLESAAPDALEKVLALVKSPDEKVALAASRDILDRVLGKAPQSVQLGGDAVNEILARLLSGRGGG